MWDVYDNPLIVIWLGRQAEMNRSEAITNRNAFVYQWGSGTLNEPYLRLLSPNDSHRGQKVFNGIPLH